MLAVERERRGAARLELGAALQRSKVARLRRRLNDVESKLQEQKDLVYRTSDEIKTAGRIVRTDDEARAALALLCRRENARREVSKLLAMRDMAQDALDRAMDGVA